MYRLCGTCVDECYVGTISMEDDIAFIDEDNYIRCGVCHDVCPEDAVRHDRERIPEEVEIIAMPIPRNTRGILSLTT